MLESVLLLEEIILFVFIRGKQSSMPIRAYVLILQQKIK